MFAIGHAATALLVKRKFPQVRILWLLLAVQFMEILWVLFNYAGLERSTSEPAVESVSDIHLVFMPYSHSIASGLLFGALAWFIVSKGLRNRAAALAIALGIVSHLLLDLATHAPDIALAPGFESPKFGLGLYSAAPMLAFFVELVYGIFCWWIYNGGRGTAHVVHYKWTLLAVIVVFNIANLSSLSAAIPGPEEMFAGRPMLFVTVIAIQIAVTLALVGIFSRTSARPEGMAGAHLS